MCGWISLPGKEEEFSICLADGGEKEHKLFHVLCPSVPMRKNHLVLCFFPKACILSAGGWFWGEGLRVLPNVQARVSEPYPTSRR